MPAPKEGNEFGVELPEEIDTHLNDLTLTAEMLEDKNRLAEMQIPKGTLVMLVKRGNEFLIPNGQMELKPGDKLLLISENKNKSLINSQPTCFSNIHKIVLGTHIVVTRFSFKDIPQLDLSTQHAFRLADNSKFPACLSIPDEACRRE